MNGTTKPVDFTSLTAEMFHWFLFSVLISLLYFGLTILVWFLTRHLFSWIELLKSGGLVTYASTLSCRTAGEYFKNGSQISTLTSVCLFGLICILLSTALVFGLLLSLGTTAPQAPNTAPFMDPERLVQFSWIIAGIAIVYGFCFTLHAKITER